MPRFLYKKWDVIIELDEEDVDLITSKIRPGDYVGRIRGGYLCIYYKGKESVSIHRVIAERMGLELTKGLVVDHIDRNPHNNRRENLRVVTSQYNNLNRDSSHVGMSSQYRGVSYLRSKKRWVTDIRRDGKSVYKTIHKDELEAALDANEHGSKHKRFWVNNDISLGYSNKEKPNQPREDKRVIRLD